MKRLKILALAALAFVVNPWKRWFVLQMADASYNSKVYEKQGGDEVVVANGGTITVESGGVINIASGGLLKFNGTDNAAALAAAVATPIAGVAAGYKIARGLHTQVAASDTVVTGLTTVVAVIASWESAPTVKQLFVQATIGDQAGTPAAGSVLIKTFKPTAVNDVTPTAATDFTENLKVAWVAVGT